VPSTSSSIPPSSRSIFKLERHSGQKFHPATIDFLPAQQGKLRWFFLTGTRHLSTKAIAFSWLTSLIILGHSSNQAVAWRLNLAKIKVE
jgi:hypothetical protein